MTKSSHVKRLLLETSFLASLYAHPVFAMEPVDPGRENKVISSVSASAGPGLPISEKERQTIDGVISHLQSLTKAFKAFSVEFSEAHDTLSPGARTVLQNMASALYAELPASQHIRLSDFAGGKSCTLEAGETVHSLRVMKDLTQLLCLGDTIDLEWQGWNDSKKYESVTLLRSRLFDLLPVEQAWVKKQWDLEVSKNPSVMDPLAVPYVTRLLGIEGLGMMADSFEPENPRTVESKRALASLLRWIKEVAGAEGELDLERVLLVQKPEVASELEDQLRDRLFLMGELGIIRPDGKKNTGNEVRTELEIEYLQLLPEDRKLFVQGSLATYDALRKDALQIVPRDRRDELWQERMMAGMPEIFWLKEPNREENLLKIWGSLERVPVVGPRALAMRTTADGRP